MASQSTSWVVCGVSVHDVYVCATTGEAGDRGQEDQRDGQPAGEDEGGAAPGPGGGEGVPRSGGAQREEGPAPGAEEAREGRGQE